MPTFSRGGAFLLVRHVPPAPISYRYAPTMDHSCPLNAGLTSLHKADGDTVNWLKTTAATALARVVAVFFELLGLGIITSHLHRTSKFKLRIITTKFSILYRGTWAA